MNKRFIRHLQITVVIMDLISLNAVFLLSGILWGYNTSQTGNLIYAYNGLFVSITWILISIIANIYHRKNVVSFEVFTRLSVYAFLFFMAFSILFVYIFDPYIITKVFLFTSMTTMAIALLINRFLYMIVFQYFKKHDSLISRVVVIGYNELSKKLVEHLAEEGINKQIIGYCEDYQKVSELSLYPIIGNIEDAFEMCKKYGATEIYSTIAPEQNPRIYDLINEAEENFIRFKIVPDIGTFIKKKVYVEYVQNIPVFSLRNEPLQEIPNRIKKRAFDLIISSFVIIFILSWLIPLIGILIKLENRGPILFVQQRSGRDNIPFPCYKFRSMKVSHDAHEKQATKDDERITKIGKFLRKTSLDEFPQFLNVFKGEMSIIGPRPHMLKHTDEYAQIISQYMVRHFLKPGISGWAQVSGLRGETKDHEHMEKRVEHDIWYLENWSLWLDLKIVFLTVYNIVKGEENAY